MGGESSGNDFGDWEHPQFDGTIFNINTIYEAETDGIITFASGGNCQGNTYSLLVGNVAEDVNGFIVRSDNIGAMTAPVRKGQFWQIARVRNVSACNLTIGFLPQL